MFLSEKRWFSLLFAEGYLTPRGWALQLDWGSPPVPLVPQEVRHLPLQSNQGIFSYCKNYSDFLKAPL
ncbi:hypothetical protein BSG1_07354 [Bacillus sp. SG-1]|nr:hypothetical protein BSG1_07354 [Bacillus sp. SG-1]